MFFRKPNPWDPGHPLPANVLAEPPGRGTLTTAYRRRKTIDAPALAPPWKPGYAYPDYVGKEPLGRGVYRTKYTPRKTISTLIPKYLGDSEGGISLGKVALGAAVLAGIWWLTR